MRGRTVGDQVMTLLSGSPLCAVALRGGYSTTGQMTTSLYHQLSLHDAAWQPSLMHNITLYTPLSPDHTRPEAITCIAIYNLPYIHIL